MCYSKINEDNPRVAGRFRTCDEHPAAVAEAYMDAQVEMFTKMVEAFMKKKLWCPACFSHMLSSIAIELSAKCADSDGIAVRWASLGLSVGYYHDIKIQV